MEDKSKTYSTAGLVLGILSIPAAIIPLLGIPISILGIVFSKRGLKNPNGKAIAGLTCSIIGLSLSVLNAAIGAYQGATGQNKLVNSLFS